MDEQNKWQIATLENKVVQALSLKHKAGSPIFIGDYNIDHMKKEHPEDFAKYGDKIEEIVNFPDYVALNPKKGSIEYIKVFKKENDKYVMVAVRATGSGTLFARTLFEMSDEKVDKYREKDAFKKI